MSVNIFGSSGGANPTSGADRKYVDQKFVTMSTNLATKVDKSGDSVSGDFNILLAEDNFRTFGVADINSGKTVSLLLGDVDNQIRYNFGHPMKIAANHGTKFTCPAGDVCRLGGQINPAAQFLKNIVMNDNNINDLSDPKLAQDAATKNYVDTRYIKNSVGFVPELTSNDKNKSEFIVSASSEYSSDKKACNVFNVRKTEWCSATNENFWIQLQCPEPVRMHKFALRSNRPNVKIHNWKLQASNDGSTWDDLYIGKVIDDRASSFNVNPSIAYIYYKIFVIKADGEMPGLSYWQLYSLDPIKN